MAAGATFGILRALEEPPVDVQLAEGPRAQFLLDTAEIVLRNEGPEGLKKTLNRMTLRMEKPLPVYALSPEGEELLNREIPEDLREAFTKGLASDVPPQRGLQQVVTPDGEKWAVFILRPTRQPDTDLDSSSPSPEKHPDDIRFVLGLSPNLGLTTATLASFFFAGLLAYSYSRPFTQLKNAFRKVAQGKLETRLAGQSKPRGEIGELLTGFDQMAAELQTQIEQQRALLHDVSHELRSPLARLNLAVGLARQSRRKTAESLDRIEHEAERLDELIGQLLTLSRLESSQHQPAFEKHNVIELLESVLDDAEFEADQTNKQVIRNIQVDQFDIPCLANALHSAFENVIRNAIRYTPEGGRVWVHATVDQNTLLIEVQDEGPGVAPEKLSRLFEPFFKEGAQAGHGLGLAIVKKAVSLNRGSVTASTKKNGLSFLIKLYLEANEKGIP
ncbi:MAG: ATP-binding protein [Limnobacter sp.]|nr:ATP-binding protein [Limnobacter sp.]